MVNGKGNHREETCIKGLREYLLTNKHIRDDHLKTFQSKAVQNLGTHNTFSYYQIVGTYPY